MENEVRDYKFDFAGYSLGGTLAELMGAKYGNETVTFNSFGAGQMKDAEINYSDNIINYGHLYDRVFNMKNTKHIGTNIYTINKYDKNSINKIISYHEMENMGDLKNILKTTNK